MLPLPVSFTRHYPRGSSVRHYRSTRDILLTRTRVTNLGFLLLAAFAALSFLVNLVWYFSGPRSDSHESSHHGAWLMTEHGSGMAQIDHLVMVPGHAIWEGRSVEEVLDERRWVLEPYQRGGGRVKAFVEHIYAGAELAREDERSLLVFSGGQTRAQSTTTEAESYMRLAHLSSVLPRLPSPSFPPSPSSTVPKLQTLRATTENYALDSYQNLIFALARFREYTGHWPARITVVGYAMKERRFAELHRAALRWPIERFAYLGIDAEGEGEEVAEVARQGEVQNGYLPYTQDLYGCHGVLLAKRRARNMFARFHPYYSSVPELGPLLDWCPGRAEGGQTAVFPGRLPWERTV